MVPSDADNVTPQGFAAVPNWLVRDPNVDYKIKLVYMVMASHLDRHGVCFPGQELIAAEAGISVPSVKRAVAAMRRGGLLKVTVTRTPNGRRNTYILRNSIRGNGSQ